MKYKLLGLAVCAAVIALSVWAAGRDADAPRRYHQHLQAAVPAACADHGDEAFCSHLPLVFLQTEGAEIPGVPVPILGGENGPTDLVTLAADGSDTINIAVTVVDNAGANNHPGDAPALETRSLIRVRGNSSRYFDKKSYLLRFVDGEGEYRDAEVMGMDTHHEWALHGPYLDKSLLRNYMWYNIAGEIMDYAPNVRFCEVFLDGEYQGLYVMTETLDSGENCRLNLSKPIDGLNKTGYLLRLDRGSSTELKNIDTFTQYTLRNLQDLDIKYPGNKNLTPELADAIAQEFSDFEKALYSYDYDTDDYGFWHWVDVGSFVDYFILNEFTCNYDAGWLSTYVYKDIGGKYKMVIWDFNSSCDNYTESVTDPFRFELQDNTWYFMMTKDEYFIQRVLDRYAQLRATYLSDGYLEQYIDETLAYLGPAVERNFEKWGYTFTQRRMLSPDSRNPASHAQAVAQLKSFIRQRGAWMDENIRVLQQYCHESKVKKFNH